MKLRVIIPVLFCFICSISFSQDYFPGGVSGAESWYIVHHQEIEIPYFKNHSAAHIKIEHCYNEFHPENTLYNFNHSMRVDKMCLYYIAPLENTTSRNVFFVGKHDIPDKQFSNVTTSWNEDLVLPNDQAPIENRFDISIKEMQVDDHILSDYQGEKESINFYNWNIYQLEHKYKSYGYKGETKFSIGKYFYNQEGIMADYYMGNFPEFISFPYELTANQKNRVESYLALKYGITLDRKQSYRNSKNIVFWDNKNNPLFGNRIFGIGKDPISNLNQLISESVHYKDFLVAAVDGLAETNFEKQQQVIIEDNHFIVFGDNKGKNHLREEINDFNVRRLDKIWLSQNTGESSAEIGMSFKANLQAMNLFEMLLAHPHLKLWMLHDEYVTNQEESDFNSHYVNYYEASNINPESQEGFFDKILFDTDANIYDQFTFGVGPQMIVQVQYDVAHCNKEEGYVNIKVVITGGVAPYTIKINSASFSDSYDTSDTELTIAIPQPNIYNIYVYDSGGNDAEQIVYIAIPDISVDLGPDVVLNASQPEVTFDAGQEVNDPEATYQWYLDGVLLDHTNPILTVDEPGEYTVVVTAGNRICEESSTVRVKRGFVGGVSSEFVCGRESGEIVLVTERGIPPFITQITGGEPSINQVHLSENFTFTDVPYGDYTVTVTDSVGEIFIGNVSVENSFGIGIDLLSQLDENYCDTYLANSPYYPYYLYPAFVCVGNINNQIFDASEFVPYGPNILYEWSMNGIPFSHSNIIEIDHDSQAQDHSGWIPYESAEHELTLTITNTDVGCSISETVIVLKNFYIRELPSTFPSAKPTSLEDTTEAAEEGLTDNQLKTRLYPNPSDSGGIFYYEVYSSDSSEIIKGTVGLYTATGALIEQKNISGQSSYTFSYELHTSGVYFIRTQANDTLLTDKIIIR